MANFPSEALIDGFSSTWETVSSGGNPIAPSGHLRACSMHVHNVLNLVPANAWIRTTIFYGAFFGSNFGVTPRSPGAACQITLTLSDDVLLLLSNALIVPKQRIGTHQWVTTLQVHLWWVQLAPCGGAVRGPRAVALDGA